MKRALVIATLLLAACDAPTAPTSAAPLATTGPCPVYQTFPVDGATLWIWTVFDPCPPDSVLEATGWRRGVPPFAAQSTGASTGALFR